MRTGRSGLQGLSTPKRKEVLRATDETESAKVGDNGPYIAPWSAVRKKQTV